MHIGLCRRDCLPVDVAVAGHLVVVHCVDVFAVEVAVVDDDEHAVPTYP